MIEIALFAPIGVASTLREMAPTFVNVFVGRGRTEIDRQRDVFERRVRTVRSTGEVALAFGLPLLRRKVEDRLQAAARVGGSDRPADCPSEAAPADRADRADREPRDEMAEVSRPRLHAVGSVGSRPDAASGAANMNAQPAGRESEHLAIPGYDELAASQVVERLVGLSRAELDEVRRYEAAHRNRRTILGKIEQLATA